MATAPITDLKNRLSHYLRLIARGETVTVLDRGIPIAEIRPVPPADEELRQLAAEGLARLPRRPLPADFLARALPKSKASVSRALGEGREDRG